MNGTLADAEKLDAFSKAYLNWMMDYVDPERKYTILLRHLYEHEFIYILPFDENRAEDGCVLRVRFENESGMECKEDYIEWPSSIFEVVLALAIRIDDQIMYDISEGERVSKWFWEMMRNLGLTGFDDERWRRRPAVCARDVYERVTTWMERKYDPYKGPNLFISDGDEDWMNLEIWAQAYRYFA